MIVGGFSIRDVHPVNIGNATKTVRFKVEFEGHTTKEELDRFMQALTDGQFHFKRTVELGNGEGWKE